MIVLATSYNSAKNLVAMATGCYGNRAQVSLKNSKISQFSQLQEAVSPRKLNKNLSYFNHDMFIGKTFEKWQNALSTPTG